MNKELFDSMQKQMTPSPEVRAALSEKLAQAPKKRPVSWMKYGAVAACAALVIGAFSVYRLSQDHYLIIKGVQQLHSYVTVEGLTGDVRENAVTGDTGTGGIAIPPGGIEILPGGAYVGDAPVQEGVEAYDKLAPYVRSNPDWYGGAYIDDTGTLVVCLVESEDPGDKSLELQVLDWTGNDRVAFTDVKYSLAHLDALMDRLNKLPEDPKCYDVMASWARDEMNNRVVVTLTEANDYILSILAEMDPDDDAIYVQVGQRASHDLGEDVRTNSAKTEDPAVHHAVPGGATVPDDEDLIADEPYYEGVHDGAHYDVEDLPQQKLPAFGVDSVPEEDSSAFTPAYDPDAGFTYPTE